MLWSWNLPNKDGVDQLLAQDGRHRLLTYVKLLSSGKTRQILSDGVKMLQENHVEPTALRYLQQIQPYNIWTLRIQIGKLAI